MKPEVMMQMLKNKCVAIEAKMKVSLEKGMPDLYEVFGNELRETQITVHLLDAAMQDIKTYTNEQVKQKMVEYMLAEVPDLAFYFKTESINKVLTDAVQKSFDRLTNEHFLGSLVNLVEK